MTIDYQTVKLKDSLQPYFKTGAAFDTDEFNKV